MFLRTFDLKISTDSWDLKDYLSFYSSPPQKNKRIVKLFQEYIVLKVH